MLAVARNRSLSDQVSSQVVARAVDPKAACCETLAATDGCSDWHIVPHGPFGLGPLHHVITVCDRVVGAATAALLSLSLVAAEQAKTHLQVAALLRKAHQAQTPGRLSGLFNNAPSHLTCTRSQQK